MNKAPRTMSRQALLALAGTLLLVLDGCVLGTLTAERRVACVFVALVILGFAMGLWMGESRWWHRSFPLWLPVLFGVTAVAVLVAPFAGPFGVSAPALIVVGVLGTASAGLWLLAIGAERQAREAGSSSVNDRPTERHDGPDPAAQSQNPTAG